MIESAKKHNPSAIDANNLTLKFGNSDNIPFPDQTFDKVYCNMVVYFWDQPEKHLKEVHRVLKPGGEFYTGIRSTDSMKNLPFVEFGFNLFTQAEWCSLLCNHEFEVSQVEKSLDPEIEVEDQPIRMQSICIVAEKK